MKLLTIASATFAYICAAETLSIKTTKQASMLQPNKNQKGIEELPLLKIPKGQIILEKQARNIDKNGQNETKIEKGNIWQNVQKDINKQKIIQLSNIIQKNIKEQNNQINNDVIPLQFIGKKQKNNQQRDIKVMNSLSVHAQNIVQNQNKLEKPMQQTSPPVIFQNNQYPKNKSQSEQNKEVKIENNVQLNNIRKQYDEQHLIEIESANQLSINQNNQSYDSFLNTNTQNIKQTHQRIPENINKQSQKLNIIHENLHNYQNNSQFMPEEQVIDQRSIQQYIKISQNPYEPSPPPTPIEVIKQIQTQQKLSEKDFRF